MITNPDMQRVVFDDALGNTDPLLIVETSHHGSGNFRVRLEDKQKGVYLQLSLTPGDARALWQWIHQQLINNEMPRS